jgi:glycosyltransferase involved in cell wall biosynthesis
MAPDDGRVAREPAVSVIMPVLDSARYLAEALTSLRGQQGGSGPTPIEILVLDGGSADASPDLVRTAARDDPRIHLIEMPGTGLVERLNRGLDMARAQLIARMDSDDVAHPERIARQVEAFKADADLVLLGSATIITDAEGRALRVSRYPVDDAELRDALLQTCPFAHPSTMFRRDAARAAGGYRAAFEGAEDHDFWLRLSTFGRVANLPAPLLRYRRHDGAMSTTLAERQAIASACAVEHHVARLDDPDAALWRQGEAIILPDTLRSALARLNARAAWQRFNLNYHRSLFYGEALRSASGQAALVSFIQSWSPADASASENDRFAAIGLRAAMQLLRAGDRMRAVQTAIAVCRAVPLPALKALKDRQA